nr:hypothetical protein [Tanacetum cinerariifolium]
MSVSLYSYSHMILITYQSLCTLKLDTEEDPEEYEEDETEDGPVNYPMDGGDDGDDDDDDSSRDDADDEDEDEEEEEEQFVLADSANVILTVELVSPPDGTNPIIPPPSTDTTTTGAWITVRLQAAISLPPEAEVERPLPMPTPPPHYLPHYHHPLWGSAWLGARPHLHALIDVVTVALPSPPLPPPLYIPPPVDCRDDIPEIKMPPRKREVGYGIRDTWVDPAETVPEIAPMSMGEVNTSVTKLPELHEHDTQDLYALLENAQDCRTRISQRVAMDSQQNSLIRSLGPDAYSMTWEVLKKKITNKYCPQGEIKKLEIELWNLKVKQNDVPAYTERFQELTLICTKFGDNETEKIANYVSGLPDNIYGSVKASKPKTLDETIELDNDLMDQKLCTYAERKTNNKRKADDSIRSNHGPRTQKCHKCNKVGHIARDFRSSGNANIVNAQRNNKANLKGNGCFECGAPGHFKRDCPKLKNKDEGNVNAQGWVYEVGNAEKKGNSSRDPDSNVVTGMFLLNNRYASILFDTGADRSFKSTAFSSRIDIVPTPLGNSYDVELADGKTVRVDTIMQGCTLNFLNHPFNLDLIPVELGSFDVIIGMNWLRRCHAVIVYDEKLVRVPYGNET